MTPQTGAAELDSAAREASRARVARAYSAECALWEVRAQLARILTPDRLHAALLAPAPDTDRSTI